MRGASLFVFVLCSIHISFAQKNLSAAVFASYEFVDFGVPLELVAADSVVLSYNSTTSPLESMEPEFGPANGALSFFVDYDKQPFVHAELIDVYSIMDGPSSVILESITNTIVDGLIAEQVFEGAEERFRYLYNTDDQVTAIIRDEYYNMTWNVEDSTAISYDASGKKLTETYMLPDQGDLILSADTFYYNSSGTALVGMKRYGFADLPVNEYVLLEQYDFTFDGDQYASGTYLILNSNNEYEEYNSSFNYNNNQLEQIIINMPNEVTGFTFFYNSSNRIEKVDYGLGPQPFQRTIFVYDEDGFLKSESFFQFNGFFSAEFVNETRFYYDSASSNSDQISASDFNIYPNPTMDKLFIATDVEILNLRLYRSNGQIILNHRGMLNTLDLYHLNTGMYILEIQTRNGMLKHKFLKY